MSLPVPTVSGINGTDPRHLSDVAAATYFADCEGPLLELAQRSQGDIRKLLTAFFSFLHRRTDFYCIHDTDEERSEPSEAPSRMGFREGDAEKLLLASFRQFPLRRIPRNRPLVSAGETNVDQAPSSLAASTVPVVKTATPTSNSSALNEIQYTEEGLQIPVGNGGSTKRYQWTQSLEECTVLLGVSPELRAKDLVVSLQAASISARIKHVDSSAETNDDTNHDGVILEGELSQRIVPSESTWTLEGGVLQISLYKKMKTFWNSVLVGDAKIDATLVDSRRNVNTYDEVTQAQIRKIIFDQQQSSKGLPTSDELSGVKPTIPPLPSGVEYIDQDILDSKMKDLGK